MTIAKLQRLRRPWAVVTWTFLLGCAPQRFQSEEASEEPKDYSSNETSGGSSSSDAPSSSRATPTSIPATSGSSHASPSTEGSDDSITSVAASTSAEGESETAPPNVTSDDGSSDSLGSTAPPSPGSSADVTRSGTDAPTSGHDDCTNQRTTCRCAPAPQEHCESVKSALLHRFSFVFDGGETPSKVDDSVGDAEATLVNASVDERGVLHLDGNDAYVQLPPKFVSRHEELTLDIWLEWFGGAANQRILNIGRAPRGLAAPDHYLAISPSGSRNVLSVQYRSNPLRSGDRLELETPLPTDSLQHLTLVLRPSELQLYLNGELAGAIDTVHRLTALDDAQVWLGRALYNDYPFYDGTLHEFRVFGRALSADEIRYGHGLGLDLPRE